MAANSLRQGQTKLPHLADPHHHHTAVIEEICKENVAGQTCIGLAEFNLEVFAVKLSTVDKKLPHYRNDGICRDGPAIKLEGVRP